MRRQTDGSQEATLHGGEVQLEARLRAAEARHAALEQRAELYRSEATFARSALAQCLEAVQEAPPVDEEPDGFNGRSAAGHEPTESEAEAAALAEALLASELALEAALTEHGRLRGEVAKVAYRSGKVEMPEPVVVSSQLGALHGEVAALCRRASAIAWPGQAAVAAMLDEGIFEDVADFAVHVQRSLSRSHDTEDGDRGRGHAPLVAAFSLLGELGRQVRQVRAAVEEATRTRGSSGLQEDALRQELADREAEWLAKDNIAVADMKELERRLAQKREDLAHQKVEVSRHLESFTPLLRGTHLSSPSSNLQSSIEKANNAFIETLEDSPAFEQNSRMRASTEHRLSQFTYSMLDDSYDMVPWWRASRSDSDEHGPSSRSGTP